MFKFNHIFLSSGIKKRTRKTHFVFRVRDNLFSIYLDMKQGESDFWARIIMHMLHMHIISIIILLRAVLIMVPCPFVNFKLCLNVNMRHF